MFVSVELGATQKSPSRSPTKVYTPLQVVEPAQISYSTPDILQKTSAVENNDGIESISLANLAEFPSFGPLFLPNSADTEEDIPTEEVVLSDHETPKMSANNSPLPQTPPLLTGSKKPLPKRPLPHVLPSFCEPLEDPPVLSLKPKMWELIFLSVLM